MKVKELVKILKTLPQESDLSVFWDGGARGCIDGIVNTGSEVVIVGDWSIYRNSRKYRAYPEDQIIYG